jgi:hypothetical protein
MMRMPAMYGLLTCVFSRGGVVRRAGRSRPALRAGFDPADDDGDRGVSMRAASPRGAVPNLHSELLTLFGLSGAVSAVVLRPGVGPGRMHP